MLEIFQTMARYNRWMNEQFLERSATLSDEERKLDRGAPFGSIHGLWNHLLLTDRVWLGRFYEQPFIVQSLADELYSDFETLRLERRKTDDDIEAFIAGLTPERLQGSFSFVALSSPQKFTSPMWVFVQHLFNHQTHHRGQMSALLEQAGVDIGVTDLPRLPGIVPTE